MEIKSLALELKADDAGVVEGYGSVFGNVDDGGDVVERGAFAKSLAKRKPKMLWQHDLASPIGVWDEVSEDAYGLKVRGRVILETQKGREAVALIKSGAIDGLSMGYRTDRYEMRGNNRHLLEVSLYETSIVTIPMNDRAMVTGVKSLSTERDFEAFLHNNGFSRWDAKIITSGGWKALIEQRDAVGKGLDVADQRDAEAIKTQLATLLERIGR